MKAFRVAALVLVAFAVFGAVGVYSGLFNFSADDPHWGLTTRLVETARERYIARQAGDVKVPGNLGDAKLISSGASEYAEMCTECHLAPGMEDTEMRTGLYPKPPNLAQLGAHRGAAQQFWIIKHGLKMTGMPAWGLTHEDERLWSMVAFLQKLPGLTPAAYQELVGSGEGGHHHHDGMESDDQDEAAAENAEHEHTEAGGTNSSAAPVAHAHATGATEHAHSKETGQVAPAVADAAAAVDRFQALLASGDAAGAAKLLEPTVLIYEAGEAEKSRAAYSSHHLQADAKFLKDAAFRVLSRTGNAAGNLAWVATESELTTAGTKPTRLITTETVVLKRDSQSWRISHIHWSSHKVN